jgi:hypothetical protein
MIGDTEFFGVGEVETGIKLAAIYDLPGSGFSRAAWHPTRSLIATLNGYESLRLWDISVLING